MLYAVIGCGPGLPSNSVLAEVTPARKGATADTIRLKAIVRRPIASWRMANLCASKIAAFWGERLMEVIGGTVRELSYLSTIINKARREWGINLPNPVVHLVHSARCHQSE